MKILAMSLVVALCALAMPPTPSDAASADENAIRKLYATYDRVWDSGDAHQLGALWAADADHVEPDGRMLSGRAAIENALAARLAGDLKGTQSKQQVESIRFLTPEIAAVDTTYIVAGAHDAAGKALPAMHGRYLDIWQKRDGVWQIVLDRPVNAPAASH